MNCTVSGQSFVSLLDIHTFIRDYYEHLKDFSRHRSPTTDAIDCVTKGLLTLGAKRLFTENIFPNCGISADILRNESYHYQVDVYLFPAMTVRFPTEQTHDEVTMKPATLHKVSLNTLLLVTTLAIIIGTTTPVTCTEICTLLRDCLKRWVKVNGKKLYHIHSKHSFEMTCSDCS